MKKLLLLFALLLFSFSVNAQRIKYTSANLNLREEPNTYSKVLIVLPRGTEVVVSEDGDNEWICITHRGHIGYLYSRYLTDHKRVVINTKSTSSGNGYYTNSRGEVVQSPTRYSSPPAGATARCRDGTYSFSRSRRGTCSHHGGVAEWL